MTLGLTYGGALIIAEAKSGRLARHDIVSSLALMSLAHSLIEDTLLVLALGANISGVLLARIVFSLLCVLLLARLAARLPDRVFDRYLFRAGTIDY
ncbi:MAG: hypothetical protein JXR37_31035 [Kiritimatiellae bacterium]|nr:hypothetical protein [Kiritimatiellia bacterium]